MAEKAIDPREFRQALGQFPTGVCIMTTRKADGEPIGVTASSFNSVSMDPPLILWSVDKGAFSASIWLESDWFCVNVLASNQTALSNRFASRGEDKFSNIDWHEGSGGAPVLGGTVACYHCQTWQTYDGGDHWIIVGKVNSFDFDSEREGLVFHKGQYAVSVTHPATSAQPVTEQVDGFVSDYLMYLLRQAHSRYSGEFYPRLNAHDVSPAEWRILTLLPETGSQHKDEVLPLVGQPVPEFELNIEQMCDRQLLTRQDGILALTEQGRIVRTGLVEMANEHESDLLVRMENRINELADTSGSSPGEQLKAYLKTLLTVM